MELTKEYFEKYLNQQLSAIKSEIATVKIDIVVLQTSFEKLNNKVDAHYVELKADTHAIRKIVERNEKRTIEDLNAFSKSWVKHDKEIKQLQKFAKVAHLKLKSQRSFKKTK